MGLSDKMLLEIHDAEVRGLIKQQGKTCEDACQWYLSAQHTSCTKGTCRNPKVPVNFLEPDARICPTPEFIALIKPHDKQGEERNATGSDEWKAGSVSELVGKRDPKICYPGSPR